VAVNGSSAASVAAALDGLGNRERAAATPGDLGEVAGCRRVVEGAAALGGLDVLVSNAGVAGPQKPIGEIIAEEWDATVDLCAAPMTQARGCGVCSMDVVNEVGVRPRAQR
jgi:NAD(P)-dependent dehydrogenase (short-subunit alcohol dehydrogenase family)